jgi:hypothetical protein
VAEPTPTSHPLGGRCITSTPFKPFPFVCVLRYAATTYHRLSRHVTRPPLPHVGKGHQPGEPFLLSLRVSLCYTTHFSLPTNNNHLLPWGRPHYAGQRLPPTHPTAHSRQPIRHHTLRVLMGVTPHVARWRVHSTAPPPYLNPKTLRLPVKPPTSQINPPHVLGEGAPLPSSG